MTERNSSAGRPVRSIGAGLNRVNLGAASQKPSAARSLSGVGLTPAARVIISGASLPTVSRANSERYQSAYSRLGTQRNTSFTDISTSVKSSITAETNNFTANSDRQGSTYRLPRRAHISSVLSDDRGQVNVRQDAVSESNQSEPYAGKKTEDQPKDQQTTGLSFDPTISRTFKHDVDVSVIKSDELSSKDSDLYKQPKSHKTTDLGEGRNTQAETDAGIAVKELPKWRSSVTNPDFGAVERSRNNRREHLALKSKEGEKGETDFHETSPETSPDSGYASPRTDIKKDKYPEVLDTNRDHSGGKSQNTLEGNADLTKTGYNTSDNSSNDMDTKGMSYKIETYNSSPYRSTNDRDMSRKSEGRVTKPQGSGPLPMEKEPAPVARPRMRRRLTKRSVSFKKLEEDEFIGFASLPEQVHRKAVRRGFEFTLMVVGETGLGKSTLINSLFLTDLYKDRKQTNSKIEERVQKTVELEKKDLEIEERGVKLKLTIVDTPGFNDAVNAEESWKPIVNFIDKQFEAYFKAESGLNRKNIQDTRVHCCLYFISPYGHGLRPVDIMVMKKLHNKVNIVPLIAKSDMLTKPEVKRLKEKVLSEVERHKIQIYQFPECDSDEDEDFKQQDRELKKSIPFAVVGSNTIVEAGGKKIRGRMYPWGIVEVENPLHCDFIRLRQMLISTHMQDLKDVTCDVHYENYRAEHITEQMSSQQKERGKLKRDSIANADTLVDTDRLLQEKEAEIQRMQQMLAKMQAQLTNQNSPQRNGKVANV